MDDSSQYILKKKSNGNFSATAEFIWKTFKRLSEYSGIHTLTGEVKQKCFDFM